MIETTRPMSQGRLPIPIGPAGVISDSGFGTVAATNREVYFSSYPTEAKGYLATGYGKDNLISPFVSTSGFVGIVYVGYDERLETSGADYWVYRTPKFEIRVFDDDVINKPWIGVSMTSTAQQTTYVYEWIEPGPDVLVATIDTPQTFTYSFSASDNPTFGSPDFVSPSGMIKEVLGTEYLAYSRVYTSLTSPVSLTDTTTFPDFLNWRYTEVSPP